MCDESRQLPKEFEKYIPIFQKMMEDFHKDFHEKELERERKNASDEITKKLELIQKIGNLKDKLKKTSWFDLKERGKLKLEILDLEGEMMYG